jgi:hypothetical protein
MNVVKNLNQETSPTDLEKKKEKARKNYENLSRKQQMPWLTMNNEKTRKKKI